MSTPAQWLWMQQTFGIGTARAHTALERYGTAEEILALGARRLAGDTWLTKRERDAIASPDLGGAQRLLDRAQALGFAILTPDSPCYPVRLRMIASPPLVLYARGDVTLIADPYPVAMVGTRDPDEYGRRAARKIATEIAGWGGTVVSGLARGIDAVCHESALAVGGRTVAFLAAGCDSDYPRVNASLRREIAARGLLVTEFPAGMPVRPHSFHVRNRLISGLSLATVVVQAARRSGSLITAGHALAQDRDVYAVCGSIFSAKMAGCHALLGEGAAPIVSGETLLREYERIYGIAPEPVAAAERIAALANPADEPLPTARVRSGGSPRRARAPTKPAVVPEAPAAKSVSPAVIASLTGEQEAVYTACAAESGFDELCERTMLEAAQLLRTLTQLEIFGLIEEKPGRRFCRI